MCGIAGVVSLRHNAVSVNRSKMMTDKLAHRGPDDAGYLYVHSGCRHQQKVSFHTSLGDDRFVSQSPLLPAIQSPHAQQELNRHDWDLFLGHRRLSILDPTPAGHQPMADLSKRYWIVFNGEIYNFAEIRETLIEKGHHFHSHSDTEVLLFAFIEWRESCVEYLNGMFSFAVYDDKEKQLFLARDRYGIKPLYYYISKSGDLIFASELKAIVEYLPNKPEICNEALMEYLTFQNIYSDKTLLRGIHMMPSGHTMSVSLERGTHKINKYWDYSFKEPATRKSNSEYFEELDYLFNQAVKRQLIADVPVGSYLSGGIDSGTICAVAAQNLPHINTFTVGFDLNSINGLELSYDERVQAERMSHLFQSEQYEMVLKAGDMVRCFPRFAYHLEEPRVGQSYPNFYASKLASKFVKVVLSGTGGDEMFGGYPWRYDSSMYVKSDAELTDVLFSSWHRLLPEQELKSLSKPLTKSVDSNYTRDLVSNLLKGQQGDYSSWQTGINKTMYFEAKTFLHGLLTVEDKLNMAHGLESRVPFLDNELVDFAMSLPMSLKIKDMSPLSGLNAENQAGVKRTNAGKYALREVASRYLPQSIASDKKQGFSAPDASWFKGQSIQYVQSRLLCKPPQIAEFLDNQKIQYFVNEHVSGRQNRRLMVWSLLNLEQFIESYIN